MREEKPLDGSAIAPPTAAPPRIWYRVSFDPKHGYAVYKQEVTRETKHYLFFKSGEKAKKWTDQFEWSDNESSAICLILGRMRSDHEKYFRIAEDIQNHIDYYKERLKRIEASGASAAKPQQSSPVTSTLPEVTP